MASLSMTPPCPDRLRLIRDVPESLRYLSKHAA